MIGCFYLWLFPISSNIGLGRTRITTRVGSVPAMKPGESVPIKNMFAVNLDRLKSVWFSVVLISSAFRASASALADFSASFDAVESKITKLPLKRKDQLVCCPIINL